MVWEMDRKRRIAAWALLLLAGSRHAMAEEAALPAASVATAGQPAAAARLFLPRGAYPETRRDRKSVV